MKGSNKNVSKVRILTRGDVQVNDIEVGDTLYELDMGRVITSVVKTSPERDSEGEWRWISVNILTGRDIHYLVSEKYPEYAPKLYWDGGYFTIFSRD